MFDFRGLSLYKIANSFFISETFHSEAPHIRRGPEDVTIHIGDVTQFDCQVTGSPRPTITWLHNRYVPTSGKLILWELIIY